MHIFIFTLLIFSTAGAYCLETSNSRKFIGKKTGVEITKAQPTDINSKNYPDIIESFVFPNAELKDVIKAMSTDLNINIIMDPSISAKKISIISYSPITVAEAYQAFLSALAIHDLTVIRSGSFLKVVKTEKALQSNSIVYEGNKKINTDQFLTSIIKLKHIDAASLEAKMKPFIDAKSVKSLIFYPPSNAVIISDYGLNVDKLRKIIQFLDIPSPELIFKVFPIKHAMAETMEKTINKLLLQRGRSTYSPRWRGARGASKGITNNSNKGIQINSLSHDVRTNSIIAMGNKTGLDKIEELIQQLDYYKDPELAGGIYVYKVLHGTATEMAKTLNELMSSSSSKSSASKRAGTKPAIAHPPSSGYSSSLNLQNISTAQSFKDVRIIAEQNTNSLLIVSNKYNYETILSILKKVDISRNQVFVKSIIMELSTDKSNEWKMANYFFQEDGGGIARIGYGLSNLSDLTSSGGATLLFPLSLFFNNSILGTSDKSTTDISNLLTANGLNLPGIKVPTLSSFIKLLQKTVGANILSTPQIMALDHQEAKVSIIEKIPVVGERTANTLNLLSTSTSQVEVETALTITPHINPDVNSIRLKIEQKIDNVVKSSAVPEELQKTNVAIKKRVISTFITLKDKETAVLGGLIRETNSKTDSKIPILGDLPLIGWLFKNSNTERTKSNLIVFITPHIIHSAEEHRTILSTKLKQRMSFIRQFTGKEDPYKELTQQMLNQQDNNTTDDLPTQERENSPPAFEEHNTDTQTDDVSTLQENTESFEDNYYEDKNPAPFTEEETNMNDDIPPTEFTEEENEEKEEEINIVPPEENTIEDNPEGETIESLQPDESVMKLKNSTLIVKLK